MSADRIEAEGREAYRYGYGERDCPYKDCSEAVLLYGYWECDAGKRQRWFRGYWYASIARERR